MQLKARRESVARFRSRLVCVRTAVQQVDLALRMQCVRNTERNRAPLSRFLGFNMTCMAGADREPFWLPRKACMPVQMTVSQNRVKPVHLGLEPGPYQLR